MTYPDAGASAAVTVAWDVGCKSHRARQVPSAEMLAADTDPEVASREHGKDEYVPLGVCSGSSRTPASQCH